ncbi:hypothetical protein C7212DRAFT_361604 [Tuber magnatum]|uniref:Uncharacterized protein n=1 Tax=Tuber magnatum TaxID=42249 RepID=A0A317T1R5_9PEZI|nr:hypothetical protein C7212DRAFT_361604 [Tuber magnatum]
MPTFDYASTNVTRHLSDGSMADIIHCIIVTGPENLSISASDFPIRLAGANTTNPDANSLANSASGSEEGESRANSEEETGPCLHHQAGGREADAGSERNLGFRWYLLSNVPAKRYLYWCGLPATRYIPKSCLVFRHQAESITFQFDWGAVAGDSVVYLCHGDGKVERLAPGDPIVDGLTFTSLGEPLDDVTGLDSPGLVAMSPGCYQADLFIDRLMGMNGFGSGDGFDTSRDEAIPLLLGTASASKENISFHRGNSLASHRASNTGGSDPNGRLVHHSHSLVISMEYANVLSTFSSQSTIRAVLNAGVCDAPDDGLVTGADKLWTAKPSNGNCITACVGSNEISKDRSTHTGGVGPSALTNNFAALQHPNPDPFAQAEEVMPLYPSVFSSGEQISIFNEGGRKGGCVGSPEVELSGQAADGMDLPEGTFDPRAPPFTAPASENCREQSTRPGKPEGSLGQEKEAWPPGTLMKGFEPAHGGFSDLEAFRARLGGVRNWIVFPPAQVAVEYLPKELKRLDWTGHEEDKGGLPDPNAPGKAGLPADR